MSFDTLAPYYRGMEALLAGGILQRCRTSFLAETTGCRHALLLGEGPGRFLVELLQANPRVEVFCVEQSARMIEVATRRVTRMGLDVGRVRFERCDALTWTAPRGTFDLIVSHFFFDCFRLDELKQLVIKISASTTEDARWLLADFRLPERGWQRCRARAVLTLMYGFFRSVTGLSATQLTPPDGFLEAAGFRLADQRLANFGLVHSDLWRRSKR